MHVKDAVVDKGVAGRRIDVRTLRYPTEPSRFALAAACTFSGLAVVTVWMGRLDLPRVIATIVGLAIGLFLLWVTLQVYRVRILGDAVLVTSSTFPAFQDAIDQARERVGYHKRVDIFVVPKLKVPADLTSYFGVRVLLVEGGAVADITTPEKRPQLLFLLGTFFGALRAKHDRWAVVELVSTSAGLRKVLAPFVGPWLRATVYTGDRIAYVCSQDLGTSLDAVYRSLVGRELGPQLEPGGLVEQARRVRRSWILRFSELFRPVPHATNRFLSLLCFVRQVQPESVDALRATLPAATVTSLDLALDRSARDQRRHAAAAVMTALAVGVGALLAYVVLVLDVPSSADMDDAAVAPPASAPTVPVTTEPTMPVTTTPAMTPGEALAGAVPGSLGMSCMELTDPAGEYVGVFAAVDCLGATAEDADYVTVYQFDSYEALADAADSLVGSMPQGTCADGRRSTWQNGDVERGTLACSVGDTGGTYAVWTIDADAVLIFAADDVMGLDEMYTWWTTAAPSSLTT